VSNLAGGERIETLMELRLKGVSRGRGRRDEAKRRAWDKAVRGKPTTGTGARQHNCPAVKQ
jgi:hypothetical protein